MKKKFERIETKLIHSGEPSPRINGAVTMPIYQSSTYEYHGEESYNDVRYIRLNNTPNHIALSEKLASLENAEAAMVTASGMAAITTSLLTVLSAGDHALFQNCLYGGTHHFVTNDLPGFGIAYDFIDCNDPSSWQDKVRPETKAIYVEAMTNPLIQVADLKSVTAFARDQGLISLIDNTFPSPFNFRPVEWGFDVSLHSCTKYLNGHSDLVAGAVIGRQNLVERITHRLNHLGGTLDPHACFLLHRGVKTLALRMQQQNRSALKIAEFLERQANVLRVNYAGLERHPDHARARELFDGFSGMLSFEVEGGTEAAQKFMEDTSLPVIAPSLGGLETLLTRPATTSHAGMAAEDRKALGITDSLIRVSVGIEHTDDLIDDFEQALNS